MEIDGEDPVDASHLQSVGDDACADGDPGFVLLVTFAIRKIGKDGGDAARTCAPGGIDQEQEFHVVVVRVGMAGLHDEDITAANVRLVLHFDGTVGKCSQSDGIGGVREGGANRFGKPRMGSSSNEDQASEPVGIMVAWRDRHWRSVYVRATA